MSDLIFGGVEPGDLPGFCAAVLRFIDRHNPPAPGGGADPSDGWIAEAEALLSPCPEDLKTALRFMGHLTATGRFGQLLAGVGSASGRGVHYRVTLDDLSRIDPEVEAVTFFQGSRGEPWYGFRRSDLTEGRLRPLVFSRHGTRAGIGADATAIPADLDLFLWRFFGRATAREGIRLMDAPYLPHSPLPALQAYFPASVLLSDRSGLFEAPNTYLAVFEATNGWYAEITVIDPAAPHAISPAVMDLIDLDPDLRALLPA